ncbi:hypothetical protein KMZ32_14135 [Phycicoccus sp. MAQZ13P-2]|uniref:hypothetical protein n=1 Tax=Phycicoccus mangrovi TaxID=2840470 RepID=UPI001BFFFACC|nr:hypothetical protein [Phycicoccus mangrovi]MBT9256564.1 hypothetical protein [Phycicoccus mangrovi]MBT9275212.1 hypothetical protein [Phycicoccus mangrovi]
MTDQLQRPAPSTTTEHVTRGLVLALVVVSSAAAAALLLRGLPSVAPLIAVIVAVGACVAYTLGAGAAPRRGVPALLVVVAGGLVALAWASAAATYVPVLVIGLVAAAAVLAQLHRSHR